VNKWLNQDFRVKRYLEKGGGESRRGNVLREQGGPRSWSRRFQKLEGGCQRGVLGPGGKEMSPERRMTDHHGGDLGGKRT